MAEGWMPGISFTRWMSMTSGRSFRFLPLPGADCRTRLSAFCRSFDKGAAEGRSSSTSMSSPEAASSESAPSETRRFLRAGICIASRAQSGVGWSISNCLRSLFVYSLPFTMSSASVLRSLRSRGTEASDTIMRSSSLSSHAGGCLDRKGVSSSSDVVGAAGWSSAEAPVSAKKS